MSGGSPAVLCKNKRTVALCVMVHAGNGSSMNEWIMIRALLYVMTCVVLLICQSCGNISIIVKVI